MVDLETRRLILRKWKVTDVEPFAKINADPRVMEFFPKTLNHLESNQFIEQIERHFRQFGFGLYATELKDNHQFIGYVGLAVPRFESPFMPCIEIGWRLNSEFWNKGYATEAATKILEFGFQNLKLNEIISFTSIANLASRRVMEKIGMTHNPNDDFDHPSLPTKSPLRRHVFYRINNLA